MSIYGLQYSQTQTGAYALVLEEAEGSRRLPIVIGSHEAQSIAIEMENMSPSRPLTHDLFRSLAEGFQIDIQEVTIYKFKEGVFYGSILCSDGKNNIEIDCRPSDAIALAVRFKCPIFTFESILLETAFERDGAGPEIRPIAPQPKDETDDEENGFAQLTNEELQEALSDALEREDYEQATIIRDELNRRKENT